MPRPTIIILDTKGSSEPEIEGLIGKTPLKGIPLDKIREMVENTWVLVKNGAHIPDLHSPLEMVGLEKGARDIMVDIALTRKRAIGKYDNGHNLFFTSEGLRWATPQVAADHCARKLGREHVMDVTCGQGGQILSLSDTCMNVIGVDIDPLNCLIAILNCLSLKKRNITIVNGDCMDPEVVALSSKGCAIFSDPARPPGAVEREMDEIIPDPRSVRDTYHGVSSGMCFEIPPYISLDKIGVECEVEYISIDGRVNRLNIYTGDLISAERSAVVLPEGVMLSGTPKAIKGMDESNLLVGTLVYEVDPTIVRAELEEKFAQQLKTSPQYLHLDGRRCLLSSTKPLISPFLKQGFKVRASNIAEKDLISVLKENRAGKVTLRYKVDPKDYWKIRTAIERRLDGSEKLQLFKGRNYLILELV